MDIPPSGIIVDSLEDFENLQTRIYNALEAELSGFNALRWQYPLESVSGGQWLCFASSDDPRYAIYKNNLTTEEINSIAVPSDWETNWQPNVQSE